MQLPAISVVICSIDDRKFSEVTSNYRALLAGTPHEIIGIHDARSLADGYNRGLRQARGGLLIFSHDDIEIASADFAGSLRRAADALDVVGVIGTSKLVWAFWPAAGHPHLHGWIAHPAVDGNGCEVAVYGVDGPVTTGLQALDGVFFAAKREVVERVPFDEATFDGFHCYDIDFTFAAHLAGFRVGTTAEIALVHASGGDFGPEFQRYAGMLDAKYAEKLSGTRDVGNWASVRRVFASPQTITRECTVERLVAITRHLRAQLPHEA